MLIRLCVAQLRGLRTSACIMAVDKNQLSKLRKKTGFPFINCKKALEKHDNNIEEAEKWLRTEAQKEGWAKASKLQDRPMSQGLIGLIKENNMAAMVEVNCETDFVSRNTKFRDLVAKIASVCYEEGKSGETEKLLWNEPTRSESLQCVINTAPIPLETLLNSKDRGYEILRKSVLTKIEWNKDAVNQLKAEGGSTLADLVAMEVGSLGENMSLRRGVFFKAQHSVGRIGHYIHSTGDNPKDKYCLMGKFGSLVSLRKLDLDASNQALEDVGRQLCQHVVGMNPQSIGYGQEADKNKDNERKLLHQEFLLDPSLTVSDFLESKGLELIDFVRFECGEVDKE